MLSEISSNKVKFSQYAYMFLLTITEQFPILLDNFSPKHENFYQKNRFYEKAELLFAKNATA